VLVMRGMVMADQGRLDEGLRRLQQAAALHELGNRRGYQSICFAITARVHAERNEVDAARAALRAAREHLWHAGQVLDFEVDVAAIWVAARRGDRADAEHHLRTGVERAHREGVASVEAYLRHEAVRAGLDPAEHVDALHDFADRDQGRRGAAWARHVGALVAGDGAGLDSAAAGFADLGQHLRAAEAYAQAAVAHSRAGSRALAARARTLGDAERAQCTGAATPALQSHLAVAGLTRRELDVIAQAASGASSRDIAETLGISVRTVETHLQRAFDKLGIHRRSELVDLLGAP
jgi:DNA-binding CsgD family transcriptional regulator